MTKQWIFFTFNTLDFVFGGFWFYTYLCSAIEWKRCNPNWVSRLRHKILETLQKTSTFCGVSLFIVIPKAQAIIQEDILVVWKKPTTGLHKAGCESIGSAKVGSWKRDLHREQNNRSRWRVAQFGVAPPSKGIGSLSAYLRRNLAGKGEFSVFSFFTLFL